NPQAKPDQTPFDLRIRIRDGSVLLVDRFIAPNSSRRERIEGVHVDAILSPTKHSYYDAGFALNEGKQNYPVWGRAVFSAARGFEAQHWHADMLPIGPLVDFALSSHAIALADGRLVNLDARTYSVIGPHGAATGLFTAGAQLVNGTVYAARLTRPIRNAHGSLRMFGDGMDTDGIDATLAGVPFHLVGGIYGFSAPSVRFFLTGAGPLEQLRQVAVEAQRQRVAGPLRFALFIEGSLQQPLVLAAFSSPHMNYDGLALHEASGLAAFSGTRFDILQSGVAYGPFSIDARGSLLLNRDVGVSLVTDVRTRSDLVPYLAQLAPGQDIAATATVNGLQSRFAAAGMLLGAGPGGRLQSPFAMSTDGTGTIGPLLLQRADQGALAGTILFDRPDNVVAASLDMQSLRLNSGTAPNLPGISMPPIPSVAGTFDGRATALVHGSNLVGGDASGAWRHAGGVVASIEAHASGSAQTGAAAGRGELRLVLGAFSSLSGRPGEATGTLDAPFSVLRMRDQTVVQLDHAQFHHAQVAGVPIQSIDGTVGVNAQRVDVYGAVVHAAGGDATLRGRLGAGGVLVATAHGVDLAALRDIGLPVRAGQIEGIADIGGSMQAPTAHLDVLLANGRYAGLPVAGSTSLAYANDRVNIHDASLLAADSYATADGTVAGLHSMRTARVQINAGARAIDVAGAARAVGAHLPYPAEGSLDADFQVKGAAQAPDISGNIRMPEGSLNGLAFDAASVDVKGNMQFLSARNGRINVGTTRVAFDAAGSRSAQSVQLRAPQIDLADFNDFFDAGDTLGGTGAIALDVAHSGSQISANGSALIARTRYRRFELGDVALRLRRSARAQVASLSVTGTHGSLTGNAQMGLAPADDVHGTAYVRGLDLATWLPAAGYSAPLFGTVDADIVAGGTAHAPNVRLQAALQNGVANKIAIKTLTLDATADREHVQIASAVLEVSTLRATAAGRLGTSLDAPFDLALTAKSTDIGALATVLSRKTIDTAGALDASAHLTGTRRRPLVQADATLSDVRVRNLVVPRIVADARIDSQTISLDRGEVDLAKGAAQFAARVPIDFERHQLAGASAPFSAWLLANDVDLSQFAGAFPSGTKLAGRIDGRVAAGGTLGNPSLSGSLALGGGSYASQLLTSPVTGAGGTITFSGTKATLSGVHLESGGGSADGSGVASIGDLRRPNETLAYNLAATLRGFRVSAPRYFRGTTDGSLAISHEPAQAIVVKGDVAVRSARIPLSAIVPPAPNPNASTAPLNVAFDLKLAVGQDVRVQGPTVDVGGRGRLHLTGTLAAPLLAGHIVSTGGTISFYRTFTVQSAAISFEPDSGIIPMVDASATTHVTSPDTDILLHATGPANNLNVTLASDPSYDREQILGLLANVQAFGALAGVSPVSSSDQPSLMQGAAYGYVNGLFTRNLLEPLQSTLGQSLGLRNLEFQGGLGGDFGANATASLGKHLSASFAQSFGRPQRQSVGLSERFNGATSLQLSLYSASGAPGLAQGAPTINPTEPTDLSLLTIIPPAGSAGLTLSYQHHF
ncbi:MAG TPA: translocation/assembly module TamB domain-containing protein, partial [Candidatus Baltobacteraceae bacterium]